MRVGVPREIKNAERRVGLTPASVRELVAHGHEVVVERHAGVGIGASDADYAAAGATLHNTAAEVFAAADMIVKVKEPQASERAMLRPGQVLFTYLHLAPDPDQTADLVASGAVCIAYETVTDRQGALPLLTPMSEVAGRMAAQEAARCLERTQGGRGVLLGGVPGVEPAVVLVLGGGMVGTEAARIASGLGASVYLLDLSLPRLRHLAETLPKNCIPLMSSPAAIRELLPRADAVIGAVLVHGARTPRLITREMLALMRPGAVLVDVAIDQGGCFETSRPTTHDQPVYEVDGILHYCVGNMPGAVPLTSTRALTNATLPYVRTLAARGWRRAAAEDPGLGAGVNIADGVITWPGVAEAFGLPCTPLAQLLARPGTPA